MAASKSLILVTGANSGIGFEAARLLLLDASNHVLLGARSVQKGEDAVEKLRSSNPAGTVELLMVDVSDENSVTAASKMVEEKHGRLDALVNNAAIARSKGSHAEQMVDCFRVNAVGAALMGEYFEPLLKKSAGTPRIVNVTSGAGSITNKIDPNGMGPKGRYMQYSVSKAAMNMVSAFQFKEFKDEGIKVFTYCPGYTESNLGPQNKVELGAKPVNEGTEPIIDILKGERDSEAGKFLKHGMDGFPW